MAHHSVSTIQLISTALTVATLVSVCALFVVLFFMNMDQPEVYVNTEGKCVKVVNFKNGDAYACQDKDVTLRKYTTVYVK